MKKCIYVLFLLFCVANPLFSQKKNIIVFHDNVTGKDTIMPRVLFANDNVRKRQHEISLVDKEGKLLRTLRAENVNFYVDGDMQYQSTLLEENDTIRRLLLPRVYIKNDISIYKYYPDKKGSAYYVKIGNDSILRAILLNGRNRLSDYLMTFPIAKDERVKAYIQRMKSTPASFDKRYKIILSENTNYLTKFRWGVLAGAGLGRITNEDFSFGPKLQGILGVFANIPFYGPLSIHSELAYREYANTIRMKSENNHFGGDAIYNNKGFILPLMIRYTANHIKGKWVPYLQMGTELQYAFKKETANQFLVGTADDYMELVESGTIPLDKFSLAFTGGMGVEWKWQPRHSVFFDIRYTHETYDFSQSGIYAVISFNL